MKPFRRRTKIVCTIGPASNTPDRIRDLIEAGMDVARLNFSHGEPREHQAALALIRSTSAALGSTSLLWSGGTIKSVVWRLVSPGLICDTRMN